MTNQDVMMDAIATIKRAKPSEEAMDWFDGFQESVRAIEKKSEDEIAQKYTSSKQKK
jgi:hypothetical protein